MVLGLVAAVVLAHGSLIKAIAMIILGLLLGMVGTDVNSGVRASPSASPELSDGIGFVAVAMGMFGIAEIIANLEAEGAPRGRSPARSAGLMPTQEDFKRMSAPILRGTALGSVLGILPGGGALLASFAAYTLEKKTREGSARVRQGRHRRRGRRRNPPTTPAAQTSFIPLLTLGIPSNAVMALMVGAMMIQGIAPGPQVMTRTPDLFWGMIASMWIGNLMLVILNLPLIGMWVQAAEGALSLCSSRRSWCSGDRRVQPQQQPVRCAPDGAASGFSATSSSSSGASRRR